MMNGLTILGPLAYQGKAGCVDMTCTRYFTGRNEITGCIGWHCSYCDKPCSSQGHRCDASQAILGEAKRLANSQENE